MKKLLRILLVFICVLIYIVSFLMFILESRLVFSLDWMYYDSVINGFIQYFLRFILCILFMFVSISEIFRKLHKFSFIKNYLIFIEFGLFIVSVIMLFLTANYINLIAFILTSLLIVIKIINMIIYKENNPVV